MNPHSPKQPTDNPVHHIHIRTTKERKNAYVKASKPGKLVDWIIRQLDEKAGYREGGKSDGVEVSRVVIMSDYPKIELVVTLGECGGWEITATAMGITKVIDSGGGGYDERLGYWTHSPRKVLEALAGIEFKP